MELAKDFLPTLIQCVWELHSLIKPLIIAHLAHYSREKLIKNVLQAGRGCVCVYNRSVLGGFMCVFSLYVSMSEGLERGE